MRHDVLNIREFRISDESDVTRIWQEAFPDDPPRNQPALIIRRKLKTQRELFLVGEIHGVVVATLLGGYDGFRCWVYHVAVSTPYRHKGYGRQMMQTAERMLTSRGCPKLNIQVRSHNREVVEFYKRLGYAVEDHISMGKLLLTER